MKDCWHHLQVILAIKQLKRYGREPCQCANQECKNQNSVTDKKNKFEYAKLRMWRGVLAEYKGIISTINRNPLEMK